MKQLLLSFLFFTSLTALAQENRFNFETFKNESGGLLNYRLLVPDANPNRSFPLVIFLHGSGERGADNTAQLKWGVMQFASDENMKLFPAYVAAPQCPLDKQWAVYDGKFRERPTETMALVREMIDELIEQYPIDEDRIYITGLSMGGFGTFDALSRYPELFAGGAPVCGGGDPKMARQFKHTPIWIFAGADDDVVLAERSLEMLNALMLEGARPGYTQLPGVGHFSWIAAYSDPLLLTWLFSRKKDQSE